MSGRARRELGRFWKFALVGSVGALVDFAAFNLLRVRFSVPPLAAQAISFSAAVSSNFIWNRLWTFPESRRKDWRQQASQFGLVNLIGLAIRTPIFAVAAPGMTRLVERLLPLLPEARLEVGAVALGSNLALAAAVLVVLFWNFSANRIWTYSDVR